MASFTFFGIQLVIAICLELLLFFPQLAFYVTPTKHNKHMTGHKETEDNKNMQAGMIICLEIFGFAFGLDYMIKSHSPDVYIPGALNIKL